MSVDVNTSREFPIHAGLMGSLRGGAYHDARRMVLRNLLAADPKTISTTKQRGELRRLMRMAPRGLPVDVAADAVAAWFIRACDAPGGVAHCGPVGFSFRQVVRESRSVPRTTLQRRVKANEDYWSADPVLRAMVDRRELKPRHAASATAIVDAYEREGQLGDVSREQALVNMARFIRHRDVALRWLKATATAAERYGPRLAEMEWNAEAAAEVRRCVDRISSALFLVSNVEGVDETPDVSSTPPDAGGSTA